MEPSSNGHYSISFDVAVRQSGSTTTAICRDQNGIIVSIVTEFSSNCNPNHGDSLATLIGVKEAASKDLKKIIIKVD